MGNQPYDRENVRGNAGITAGGDVEIENTGQLAIGKYITQFTIEKPSGEALVKLIDFLDRKRQESVNIDILNSYTPSALPDYPPRLRTFVTENRVDELTQALIYLRDRRILLTSGVGGVGKTTLARALIETRPANVPLPFWFDFSKKMDATLGDVLEKLAGYMKTPDIANFKIESREAGQEDINRLTGELQKGEPVWLVFDNLEIIQDGRHFHDPGIDSLFTALRGSTHQAKIIVTSRILPILGNGESLIDVIEEEKQELKGLKTNFAVDFLTKNGLNRVEPEKLEELANGVDGHPLALRLLIELVKEFGVGDTLKDLSMYQRHKEDTIKKARRLFDKLAGDEKELLERISVYRQPELMDAIEKMFTDKTPVDAMKKLIDKSLLETDHKGNYWLHPLVREFAYDDLEDKIEAHKLAYQYYLSLPLPEKRIKKEDVPSLIEAHYHACIAKEYDKAADIIFDYNMIEDLYMQGSYRTLFELFVGVLPKDHLRDKTLLSSIRNHSIILGNLGFVYRNLGDTKKAIEYYEEALKIAQEIGDRRGEGNWLGYLGFAYLFLGEVRKAIQYYEKALKIAQETGDRRNEATLLSHFGNAYDFLGEVKKAIPYYEKTLEIFQELGDRHGISIVLGRHGIGMVLGNLGSAYRKLGNAKKAIEYHEKALKIAQEIEDIILESVSLGNLGQAYHSLGQIERAIEYYEQALKIHKEIGNRRGEGSALGNLGLAYANLGQVEHAIECFEKALEIAQEVEDRRNEGLWLGNLGYAYHSLGEVKKAIECYEQGLKIVQDVEDRRTEGAALGSLGNAYCDLGEVRKAIEYYKKALEIAQEIGDRRNEGRWLEKLVSACHSQGDVRQAIGYSEKALEIAQKIRDKQDEGKWLKNLGIAYFKQGKAKKAIEYHEQALTISREIGNRRDEGADLGNLGIAYYSLGKVEHAIEYHEQALKIAREIGDRRGEGVDLGNLGNAYRSLGEMERAIKYVEQALKIAREIGDRRNEGNWLGSLGIAYANLDKVEHAIEYFEQALKIAREIGDRRTEDVSLGNLGRGYSDLGQVERAIEYYEQAVKIAREIGDRRGEGIGLNNLGVVFKDLEKYDLALACYLLARKIRREIRDKKIERTENNINELKNKIGKNEFQKLLDTVEPKSEEIVQSITK